MKKRIIFTVLIAAISVVGCSNKDSKVDTNSVEVVSTLSQYKVTTADEALERLKKGNEAFVNDKSENMDISKSRRDELSSGQNPFAVVVSCSDSRVTPTHVFDTGLGDLFEIRLAGNVVDEDALGSIEYGVEHLGTKLVVIMGHEKCGAVTSAYEIFKENKESEGNIGILLNKIKDSVIDSSSIEEASHKNMDQVLKEVKEDEVIKKLIEEDKVKVVGAYYTLDGKVEFIN